MEANPPLGPVIDTLPYVPPCFFPSRSNGRYFFSATSLLRGFFRWRWFLRVKIVPSSPSPVQSPPFLKVLSLFYFFSRFYGHEERTRGSSTTAHFFLCRRQVLASDRPPYTLQSVRPMASCSCVPAFDSIADLGGGGGFGWWWGGGLRSSASA